MPIKTSLKTENQQLPQNPNPAALLFKERSSQPSSEPSSSEGCLGADKMIDTGVELIDDAFSDDAFSIDTGVELIGVPGLFVKPDRYTTGT